MGTVSVIKDFRANPGTAVIVLYTKVTRSNRLVYLLLNAPAVEVLELWSIGTSKILHLIFFECERQKDFKLRLFANEEHVFYCSVPKAPE